MKSKTIPDGKSIYEFTDEKYHNGKPRSSDEWKESYKKLYPGFMNKKNSKGLCMPCCFNMSDKKGNYKISESRKRMEDECCEEEGKCAHYKYGSKKKGKSRIFVAPINPESPKGKTWRKNVKIGDTWYQQAGFEDKDEQGNPTGVINVVLTPQNTGSTPAEARVQQKSFAPNRFAKGQGSGYNKPNYKY